jgi:hypothetical protein
MIVTRNGTPHTMVIAVDESESLQLTREFVRGARCRPEILTADQEISVGDYHTLDELRTTLERRQRQEDVDS